MNFDFHVVVHGIAIIAQKQPDRAGGKGHTKIMIPYDSCHSFIAACLDYDGSVIWQCDLPNGRLSITGVRGPTCEGYATGDPDLLYCSSDLDNYGSNTWCSIGDLPFVKPVPLRRFNQPVLDGTPDPSTGYEANTYRNNQLGNVDARGVPSAYALMFGPQTGGILFNMGTDLKRITPGGEDDIARLHIYAESPKDIKHNALLTISYCIRPAFDLRTTEDAVGQAIPSFDLPVGVKPWEQDTLYEHQQIQFERMPPCFMDNRVVEDNSPRTCIPVVGGG